MTSRKKPLFEVNVAKRFLVFSPGVTTGLCPKCTFKYRQPKGCTDGRVVVCSVVVVGPAAPAAGWGLALRPA